MRHRLQLVLQVMLVLVASLLGIATNYATSVHDAPWLLRVIQEASLPAIVVLVAVMVVGQVVVYRLENPAPPHAEWPRGRVPYPGLDAFEEDEAAVFFGREAQIRRVCRRLHASSNRPADRFLAVVGSSGSGKSSLVRAGVLPRLRGRRWAIVPAFSPGPNPLAALAAAVAASAGGQEPVNQVLRRMRQGPHAVAAELSRLRRGPFQRTLLVVDQFEEVLTLAGERERAQFLEALRSCLERDPSLCVLATLRVGFLGELVATEHAELVQHPVVIGALGKAQLEQAIQGPAALAELSFAEGLVPVIVDDVRTDDALPLLAYLLQELYFASSDRGSTITEELYRDLGGVAGALARQADHTMEELCQHEGTDDVLQALLKFVTVQGREVARRKVPLSELTAHERRIVDAFVDARLLVSGVRGDGIAGEEPYAQVTHEAMFRQWAPLRQEVEAHVEQLRQRAELERWAGDWENAGRSDDYLLTGERLSLAQRWLTALEEVDQASDEVREFVRNSEHRDAAFLRRISENVGQHVLQSAEGDPERAILLSLAALSECSPTPSARRALMTALACSHLRTRLDGHTDTVRDIVWSPDGHRLATASRDGTARIFDARTGRPLAVLPAEGAMVESVAWSPDSTRVATSGRDHIVRVWDALSGAPLRVLTGADDIGRQVAWSPDGRYIAATFRDRTVRIWEVGSGRLAHTLRGHGGDVWGVAWSPDSARLASASHDQTVLVWDLSSGSLETTLSGHSGFVEGVAWSPDGSEIATGSGDHTVRIWDARDGRLRLLVRGHGDYVWNVAWSPDGQMLASASSDRTVRVVSTTDAEVLTVLRGHTDTVWGVAWSPTGEHLATSSTDNTARIWDLHPSGAESVYMNTRGATANEAAWSWNGDRVAVACDDGAVRKFDARAGSPVGSVLQLADQVVSVASSPQDGRLALSTNDGLFCVVDESDATLFEHRGEVVESCDWAPDGRSVATGGHDGSVRVWSARTGTELVELLGHQDWVGRVRWSPSGTMIASSSDDRTCRLWNVAESQQLVVLRGHENYVDDIAWSPDEQRVATASGDWTAAVWDVTTGRRIDVMKGHEGRVRAVAWSPDGEHLATGSDDGTVRVWSAHTFEETAVIGVHRDRVTSVTWSGDGTRLLTTSCDGTSRIWPAEPDIEHLEVHARGRVFRVLSDDERAGHLLPGAAG